jgi:hypothetical protein
MAHTLCFDAAAGDNAGAVEAAGGVDLAVIEG